MPSTHHAILEHLVFSTKNRQPLIDESWESELYKYTGKVVCGLKSHLIAAGGIEDHVHLLVKLHPSPALAELMQSIKSNSSRWVNQTKSLKVLFQWQGGYGAFSVSESRAEAVKAYIANQREHHSQVSFADEYLTLLRLHGVMFDSRYVFDQESVAS